MAARAPLQEGGQRQPLAQRLHGFVGREARDVGRDLEENAVRLPEVERAEVIALHLAGVRHAEALHTLGPSREAVVVGRAEGDVVHAAGAFAAGRRARLHHHVQLGRGAAGAHLEDVYRRATSCGER